MNSESEFEKTKIVNGLVQSNVKLNGKTVVITGANSGIGFETMLNLAKRGAKIIMACRDLAKAEEAKSMILKQVSEAELIIMKLDLASLASVRQFAKEFLNNHNQLHILINNAGVMMCPQWKTEDGYEMQLGVNHIGHFLLINLLLDVLKKSAPSRIVIVSSLAHRRGRWDWDDVMQEKNYSTTGAYCNSKLANIMHCIELSKRLQGTGVTCNVLHPGVIDTDLARHIYEGSHLPFLLRAAIAVVRPIKSWFLITPEKGAQTSIYCAIAPELNEVSGKYFSNCAEVELQSHATNEQDAQQLWKLSEEWTKEKQNSTDEISTRQAKF